MSIHNVCVKIERRFFLSPMFIFLTEEAEKNLNLHLCTHERDSEEDVVNLHNERTLNNARLIGCQQGV